MSTSGLLKARMASRGEGSGGETSYHSSNSTCQHSNSSSWKWARNSVQVCSLPWAT